MLTSKQRAMRRGKANTMDPVFIVGKGEIDETITFEFNPLWQVSALDAANIRVANANADAVYLDRSVVSPEETRERLAADPDSGYAGIDVEDLPEVPEDDVDASFGGAASPGGGESDIDYDTPETGRTDERDTKAKTRTRTTRHDE